MVSAYEAELLRQERAGQINRSRLQYRGEPGVRHAVFITTQNFLFIGSFQHTPNIDAVLFFIRDIYPKVRGQLPDAKFYIIGDKAPPEVIALADENIIITGLQPDVRPYFDSVRLSIAPLRYGAGVKGKINQSMGLGVPVVATSIAAEGMFLTNREDILIADTPGDFAEALIELYHSKELWERISSHGIEKTQSMYSVEVATKQLAHLLSDEHIHAAVSSPLRNDGIKPAGQVASEIQPGTAR